MCTVMESVQHGMIKTCVPRQRGERRRLPKRERSVWHIQDALGSNQEGANLSQPFMDKVPLPIGLCKAKPAWHSLSLTKRVNITSHVFQTGAPPCADFTCFQ